MIPNEIENHSDNPYFLKTNQKQKLSFHKLIPFLPCFSKNLKKLVCKRTVTYIENITNTAFVRNIPLT